MADPTAGLIPFDPDILPPPLGMPNTGVCCFFNASMQCLAGCSSLLKMVAVAPPQTRTAEALRELLATYAAGRMAGAPTLLSVLAADLRLRRPTMDHGSNGGLFGNRQSSASEFLSLLLDAVEPDGTPPQRSPVGSLFLVRQRIVTVCKGCGGHTEVQDRGVILNMFGDARATTPEEFSAAVCQQKTTITQYKCDKCKSTTTAVQVSFTSRISTVLIVLFNIYGERYGGARGQRYFPAEFTVPARGGGRLRYRLIGQAVAVKEHLVGLDLVQDPLVDLRDSQLLRAAGNRVLRRHAHLAARDAGAGLGP